MITVTTEKKKEKYYIFPYTGLLRLPKLEKRKLSSICCTYIQHQNAWQEMALKVLFHKYVPFYCILLYLHLFIYTLIYLLFSY